MNYSSQFLDIADWLEYWLVEQRLGKYEQTVLQKYYASYISNFGPYLRKHYANQVSELESIVLERGNTRILEVGCGCGSESLWFGIKGASVIGIDLQIDRLRTATARLEHVRKEMGLQLDVEFKYMSVFDAVELGQFDIIWMEQAFHHVEPRKHFLELLAKLLNPDGLLIISEANGWNPLLQLQLFLQRGFKTIKEYVDKQGNSHIYGNERILTPFSLSRQLKRTGFLIDSLRYYRVFPNIKLANNLIWLEALTPDWLVPAYTHYNIVAKLDNK